MHNPVMLNAIILSFTVLIVIMLSAVMLNVTIMSVVVSHTLTSATCLATAVNNGRKLFVTLAPVLNDMIINRLCTMCTKPSKIIGI
jgi:hypothetical protein